MEADETWIQHPDAPLQSSPGEPRRKRPVSTEAVDARRLQRDAPDPRLDPHEISELDIAEPPTSPLTRTEPPTERIRPSEEARTQRIRTSEEPPTEPSDDPD
jgi:hypothetical protein